MALDLTPEQKAVGKANFDRTVGEFYLNRRDFMKGALAAGGAVAATTAAAYYGYKSLGGKPVKAGIIGTGDEGGVLIGAHNPEFLEFIAYSDIRPSNQKRIFTGEPTGPRLGFNRIYGKDAEKKIKLYEDYKELLANKDVEAVVIALPLNLHAPVAIDAMRAGKHVLCEKLMGWNITQCKDMIKASDETDRVLTIGHQRHYSMLYAHAVELINSGILGDIKYIRALWHRNNAWPALDEHGKEIKIVDKDGKEIKEYRDGWRPAIKEEDRKALEGKVQKYGFKDMEHLVRWRLYRETGGGLMAELGSHQLDASSIFLGKVHPVAVSGYGGKIFYHDDREIDDHVFVTFEFPGKNYWKDPHDVSQGKNDENDIVVVTYSSISTNAFEPYGECVMGHKGTLVVEMEQSAMLYAERNPNAAPPPGSMRSTSVTVSGVKAGKPALDTSGSGPAERKATATGALGLGEPISRGYREEMEHFAYCIRMHEEAKDADEKKKWRMTPKCHGRVAMADAIIALTSNLAMKHHKRIEFDPKWFEAGTPEVPDAENQVAPPAV